MGDVGGVFLAYNNYNKGVMTRDATKTKVYGTNATFRFLYLLYLCKPLKDNFSINNNYSLNHFYYEKIYKIDAYLRTACLWSGGSRCSY